MKTVGQILKEARIKKNLSLEEIEKKIKIRAKYLAAIEDDNFHQISGGTVVAQGFIKNYGEFLDLSPQILKAVFRRDFGEGQQGQILPRGIYRPLGQIGFSWTPRLTAIAGIFFFLSLFILFLIYQFFLFFGPPQLRVILPQNGAVFQEQTIEIKGKTDRDAAVYINSELVSLDERGNFSEDFILTAGENKIRIEAVSRRGKKAIIERKVFFQFP